MTEEKTASLYQLHWPMFYQLVVERIGEEDRENSLSGIFNRHGGNTFFWYLPQEAQDDKNRHANNCELSLQSFDKAYPRLFTSNEQEAIAWLRSILSN